MCQTKNRAMADHVTVDIRPANAVDMPPADARAKARAFQMTHLADRSFDHVAWERHSSWKRYTPEWKLLYVRHLLVWCLWLLGPRRQFQIRLRCRLQYRAYFVLRHKYKQLISKRRRLPSTSSRAPQRALSLELDSSAQGHASGGAPIALAYRSSRLMTLLTTHAEFEAYGATLLNSCGSRS